MIKLWLCHVLEPTKNSCLTVIVAIIFILANQIEKFKCDKWEYKLTHDILDGYDYSIRPSIHHNSTLNVTFGLALTQIIDVVRIY